MKTYIINNTILTAAQIAQAIQSAKAGETKFQQAYCLTNSEERSEEIFRKRKDKFRRWRDMGVFVMIGVYAFSVIDAYIDASLSEFDISDDLTLRVEPTVLNDKRTNNPFKSTSLGLQCSLRF